jgi:hypothetical protein
MVLLSVGFPHLENHVKSKKNVCQGNKVDIMPLET